MIIPPNIVGGIITTCEMDYKQKFRSGMKDDNFHPARFAVAHGISVDICSVNAKV